VTRAVPLDVTGGHARLLVDAPAGGARAAHAIMILGHGAGGGPAALDLQAFADRLPAHGYLVLRFEQPWRVAGRGVAVASAQLDLAWLDALAWLATPKAGVLRRRRSQPLIVGGRSAGARVACRTALAVGASACVALAFPSHPPGRPERSRLDELVGAGVPTLVIAGTRDTFGGPAAIPAGLANVTVAGVPGADHGFKVPRSTGLSPVEVGDLVVAAFSTWYDGNRS
jgi:predicted alpha/beta-hydrolase family hydrolase